MGVRIGFDLKVLMFCVALAVEFVVRVFCILFLDCTCAGFVLVL